jgi:hypothetical protein
LAWVSMSRQVRSFCVSFMRVAHGAEGFEDFGDVGGFGAGETLREGFGGDGFFVGGKGEADGFDAVGKGFWAKLTCGGSWVPALRHQKHFGGRVELVWFALHSGFGIRGGASG